MSSAGPGGSRGARWAWARRRNTGSAALRFALGRCDVRVSYWLAPGRRVVLLTAFAKTRQRERAEVARAIAAQRACEQGHAAGHPDHGTAGNVYERKWD